MPPNGDLHKRCMKCGTTSAELGQRLKRCARCGGGGLDIYYCVRVFSFATGPPVDSCFQNEVCQAADWESHKRMCKKLPPWVDGRALRTHISSWFMVYKALLVGHSYAPYRCPDFTDDRSGQSTRRLLLRRMILTQTAAFW